MIVDDSILIRKILTKYLTDMGHNVIGEAKDGDEAIELYHKLNPDLMMLDITTPRKNGIDVLHSIKQKHPEVKAIIMSKSHGEEKMVMDAIMLGAKGYVYKPIKEENIQNAIKKVFPDL
jgi:two-component system chemotaxis response regulator CheY